MIMSDHYAVEIQIHDFSGKTYQVYYEGSLPTEAQNYVLTPSDPAHYTFGGWAVAPDKHSESDVLDCPHLSHA